MTSRITFSLIPFPSKVRVSLSKGSAQVNEATIALVWPQLTAEEQGAYLKKNPASKMSNKAPAKGPKGGKDSPPPQGAPLPPPAGRRKIP